jgi:hypothetical protein
MYNGKRISQLTADSCSQLKKEKWEACHPFGEKTSHPVCSIEMDESMLLELYQAHSSCNELRVLEIASPCFSKKDKGHLKAQFITKQIADECLEMWQQKQPGKKGKSTKTIQNEPTVQTPPLQTVPPLQPFIQTSTIDTIQDTFGQDFIDIEPDSMEETIEEDEEQYQNGLEQDFIDSEEVFEKPVSIPKKSKPSFLMYIGMVLVGIVISLVVLYILIYYIS